MTTSKLGKILEKKQSTESTTILSRKITQPMTTSQLKIILKEKVSTESTTILLSKVAQPLTTTHLGKMVSTESTTILPSKVTQLLTTPQLGKILEKKQSTESTTILPSEVARPMTTSQLIKMVSTKSTNILPSKPTQSMTTSQLRKILEKKHSTKNKLKVNDTPVNTIEKKKPSYNSTISLLTFKKTDLKSTESVTNSATAAIKIIDELRNDQVEIKRGLFGQFIYVGFFAVMGLVGFLICLFMIEYYKTHMVNRALVKGKEMPRDVTRVTETDCDDGDEINENDGLIKGRKSQILRN